MARGRDASPGGEATYSPKRLIIECVANYTQGFAMGAGAPQDSADMAKVVKKAGGRLDTSFEPLFVPGVGAQNPMAAGFDNSTRFSVSDQSEDGGMIVVADGDEGVANALADHPMVKAVYADLPIEPCLICPGSPPMGNADDVRRLLCTSQMHGKGLDGNGVLVAIVDTGINSSHLASKGLTPAMDAGRSWVPVAGMTPFNAPVGHGTMCAYDALIAAPKATLLDVQLLRAQAGGGFSGFLSEAVRAFAHLRTIMTAPHRPGAARSLVVNNSWGMFHPSWDFPPGDPRNYSDNPGHPFNRAVAALEAAGADILFAAGNCGANCPDGRCQGVTANAIYGANGHPSVLTVAGVDTTKQRVGYSSQGPGRLARNKPDISGFTHFSGSGVYAADGGTSAACPVVTGVVAAARTKRPFSAGNPSTSPHAMRELIRTTAEDVTPSGFDFDTGWGIVNGCAIANKIVPTVPDFRRICDIAPGLCPPWLRELCRRYPHLCDGRLPFPPFPPRPPGPLNVGAGSAENGPDDEEAMAMLLQFWLQQSHSAPGTANAQTAASGKGGCGCGCKGG